MAITLRDKALLEFISEFKVATTSTIHTLFFPNTSLRFCQARLKKLDEYGYLNRIRDHFTMEYVYYINKLPKQIEHRLLISSFCAKINNTDIEVIKLRGHKQYDNLICDGLMGYKYKEKKYIAFIEAQRKSSGRQLDIDKYINFYRSNKWKEYFPVFPKLIAITNYNIDSDNKDISLITIKEDLSNIGVLCRD